MKIYLPFFSVFSKYMVAELLYFHAFKQICALFGLRFCPTWLFSIFVVLLCPGVVNPYVKTSSAFGIFAVEVA